MQRAPGAGRPSALTLLEVLVTVAVVSLLVAVLAPVIARNLEDARVARAANEVQVIAAAVGAFYKDTGHWPSMDAGGVYGGVTTLVGSNAEAAIGPGCTPGPDSGHPVDALGWRSDASRPEVDYLRNHLLENSPKGVAAYPTSGPQAWRGPYLDSVLNDPWNTPYLVNIAATDAASGIDKGFVLSAGPNGRVETPFAGGRATSVSGDDIGTVFFLR